MSQIENHCMNASSHVSDWILFVILQRMSSQPFVGLAFEADYMVRIVPFPTFMNDSCCPPSFLRTNSGYHSSLLHVLVSTV